MKYKLRSMSNSKIDGTEKGVDVEKGHSMLKKQLFLYMSPKQL